MCLAQFSNIFQWKVVTVASIVSGQMLEIRILLLAAVDCTIVLFINIIGYSKDCLSENWIRIH